MAEHDQHVRKAEHNESFFGTFDLATTPYVDWAVTVLFYAALHDIRALGAWHGRPSLSSYRDEDRLFAEVPSLKGNRSLWTAYRQLKDDSRAARYDMRDFTYDEVQALADDEFRRIRSFARTSLGTP